MEIEEAFTSYLLSYTALTALISNRIYPEELPLGTQLPAVVWIKISDVKEHTLEGQYKQEQPIFQFTTYGTTKAAVRAVTNQLKAALCDYRGTLSGIFIQKIELQNEMSNLEKSSDGTLKIYTEDLEFQITFNKE